MRKAAIVVAGAAVLLGGCGLAAMQWAQSRADAEVERTFAAIRALGATVAYDKPRFEMMSRRVTIENVKIGFGPGAANAISAGRVTAGAIGLFTSDFEAGRVEIANVEVRGAPGARGEPGFQMKVPSMTASRLHMPGVAPSGPPDPGAGAVAGIGSYLALVRFQDLGIETIEARVLLPEMTPAINPRRPALPSTSGPIIYTYSGVKLEGMADGRIGKVTADKVAFKGPTGTGTIDGFGVEALDVMPLFKAGLERRRSSSGFYQVQGRQWIGGTAVKMPDGGEFAIGGMIGSGFAIDPAKLSIETIGALIASAGAIDPSRPPSAQSAHLMNQVGRLYEGMRAEVFEINDMRVVSPAMPRGSSFRIGKLAMKGFDAGRIDTLQADQIGTSGGAPASQFKMERFALRGLDMAALMRLSGDLVAAGARAPAADLPGNVMALLSGIEVRGTEIPDFGKGGVQIGLFDLSWGSPSAGGMPAETSLKFQGVLPIRRTDPTFGLLAARGVSRMAVDVETATRYARDKLEIVAEAKQMNFEHIGRLQWRMVIGGVIPTAYDSLPLLYSVAVPNFTLDAFEITARDGGLVGDIYLPARNALAGAGVAAPDPIAQLKADLLEPEQPGGNLGAMLDALGRFLAAPGQTISLKLKAAEPVRLGAITGGGQISARGDLQRALEKFAVDVGVGR